MDRDRPRPVIGPGAFKVSGKVSGIDGAKAHAIVWQSRTLGVLNGRRGQTRSCGLGGWPLARPPKKFKTPKGITPVKTTFLSALAVFAGLTGQASAQSAGTDWSGFYAGGGFATGVSNLSVAELSAVGPTNGELGESDLDQFFVFAGYTWDFGTFTLGGELQLFDGSPSGFAGVAGFQPQICPIGTPCADASVFSTIDPTFRLRAIGGYEVGDNTLVMGALGIARADVTYNGAVVTAASAGGRSQQSGPFPVIATESDSIDGISLGFGVEHRVADGFS
ncbi:MAG TPA: hypothetical protein EYP31_09360, partial [Roseibacterium sp.]|nr:hypothetical protein [Roseibacterium sp.]